MALVQLSDEVIEAARRAGLPVREIAERALRDVLSGAPMLDRPALDADERYRQGFRLGEHWVATTATVEELITVAALGDTRWQSTAIGHGSLATALVEHGEAERTPEGVAWIDRSPFSEGVIEAVRVARGAHMPHDERP